MAALMSVLGRPAPDLPPSLDGFEPRVVSHRYGPYDFSMCLADHVSASWYDLDWAGIPELDFLASHQLRRGALAFNLGAHQSLFAAYMARMVGPLGEVVSVDAMPHNVRCGTANKRLNGLRNLRVVNAAVTDIAGDAVRFAAGVTNGHVLQGAAEPVDTYEIGTVTIDSLTRAYGPPQVLLIDIEGFEARALAAAGHTLGHHPDAVVEVHTGAGLEDAGGSVAEVLSYFPESRYERYACNDVVRQPRPIASVEPEVLAERFYFVAVARRPRSARARAARAARYPVRAVDLGRRLAGRRR